MILEPGRPTFPNNKSYQKVYPGIEIGDSLFLHNSDIYFGLLRVIENIKNSERIIPAKKELIGLLLNKKEELHYLLIYLTDNSPYVKARGLSEIDSKFINKFGLSELQGRALIEAIENEFGIEIVNERKNTKAKVRIADKLLRVLNMLKFRTT